MSLPDSRRVNGAASATPRLPRNRRNLVYNALREVEKFVPRSEWMAVVVSTDPSTVRAHRRLGAEHPRPPVQPAGATPTSTMIPQPAARTGPAASQIIKNFRAKLYQMALGFSRMRSCETRSVRSLEPDMHPTTPRHPEPRYRREGLPRCLLQILHRGERLSDRCC